MWNVHIKCIEWFFSNKWHFLGGSRNYTPKKLCSKKTVESLHVFQLPSAFAHIHIYKLVVFKWRNSNWFNRSVNDVLAFESARECIIMFYLIEVITISFVCSVTVEKWWWVIIIVDAVAEKAWKCVFVCESRERTEIGASQESSI